MKQCVQFSIKKSLIVLFVFFYLLSSNLLFAQNTPQGEQKFIVGTFIASSGSKEEQHYTQYNNYQQLLDLGVNALYQVAVKDVPSLNQNNNYAPLSLFDFIWAANDSGTGTADEVNINAEWQNIDWISYFTSAKYMKWEAEGDPLFTGNVKIKHEIGSPFYDVNGVSGWQSGPPNANNTNSFLIKGPNYWQYPRYTFTNVSWNPEPIRYQAVFHMKMASPSITNVPVCSLFVVMTDSDGVEHTLNSKLVTSSMLLSTDYVDIPLTYNYIGYFNVDTVNRKSYSMPGSFGIKSPPGYNIGSTIEFKVQWLGNVELLVDYVEVYDQMIWDSWFNNPLEKYVDSIVTYDHEFKNENPTFYNKLKYYYTMDEPHSIDGYEPLRRVQEILDDQNNNIQADLLTHWYPEWNGIRDGDPTWNQYVQLAQPKKLMFWYAPFTNNKDTFVPDNRDFTLYFLHKHLQQAYTLDSLYFLSAQTFGRKVGVNYESWMLPDTSEVLAETMLALAHGCKGIFFENYYSYSYNEGLVKIPVGNHYYEPRPIWYTVKKIAARLNGVLGKTLVSLNYNDTAIDSGFLRLYPYASIPDMQDKRTGTTVTKDYLTLSTTTQNPTPSSYNFHAGFFDREGQPDNKYFLLANLLTTESRWVSLTVTDNGSDFINTRFRNIESEYNFDITFTNSFSTNYNFPAGEGYLYQVAPVVLYGGKLVYSEDVGEGLTLNDDMTIENGATLSVYGTYNAKANITVKVGGKIVSGTNGKIVFDPGKKLIIEGSAQVYGTVNNRLTLEFNSSTSEGILVKTGASLLMSYCDIKNAQRGINTEVGPGQITISNVNFTNCSQYAIALIGLIGDGIQTPPPPTIYKCNITGSSMGISIANYNEILIQENNFSGSGISIASVVSAFIQGNVIDGGSSVPFAGIFMDNSGGYIRCNIAANCLNGIRLANSSPDVGDNTLEHNKYHGLFIGSGSIPNMIGKIISGPPYTWYGASGYNRITENGMGSVFGEPPDNDGSEIYFSSTSALLGEEKRPGCNEIIDDRRSTPTMNTLLLLNGSLTDGDRQLYAQNNYWGTTEPSAERFGQLSVIFSPFYLEPCLLPDGGEDELVLKTSTGIVVDTLYPSAFVPEDITALEASYSEADKHFIALEMEQAKTIYEQIVQGNYTSAEKLPAYNKLYTIANLTRADESYFNSLQSALNNIAATEPDTLLIKIYQQNAIKCDVSKEEYLTAISKFDNIIQQNPNSEEAVYAEIDIMTTALNLDTTNSGLGKIASGKYLVKGTSDYLTKLNNLLQTKFGINNEQKEQIIPKEYSLYQNYPNPFNPTTTIKFDLPKDGLITLDIYDILGRRVTTLVSEFRSAGSYEHSFNASSLASGVYVYKLQAGDFINSKKMLLIK
ncbi:MAG TPA: hypothetical protein DHV28_18700 [Ignavibacteriales bacterium]|nr:hypothetical protein [Ignavibacteriales bacterium]